MRADRHLQNRLGKFLFNPPHTMAIIRKPNPKIKVGIWLIAVLLCFLFDFFRTTQECSNNMIPTAIPIRSIGVDLAGHAKYLAQSLRINTEIAQKLQYGRGRLQNCFVVILTSVTATLLACRDGIVLIKVGRLFNVYVDLVWAKRKQHSRFLLVSMYCHYSTERVHLQSFLPQHLAFSPSLCYNITNNSPAPPRCGKDTL